MFLKRICIFLAVVFLSVDIFLVSMYFQAKNSAKYISDGMIDDTVSYFRSVNIKLDKSVISEAVPQNKIYTFTSSNLEVGQQIAEKLVKSLGISATSINPVETPDGTSYSLNTKDAVAGSFRVYSDSFRFEYASADFSKEDYGVPSSPFENDNTKLGNKPKNAVASFLSGLTLGSNPKYCVNGSYNANGCLYVSVSQKVSENADAEDMYANLVVSDGRVVYAEGKMIFALIKKSCSEQLYDGVNALMRADCDNVSRFLSEKIVYTHRYAGNGIYYLIPVWRIEYIDSDGVAKTQYVDAIKS